MSVTYCFDSLIFQHLPQYLTSGSLLLRPIRVHTKYMGSTNKTEWCINQNKKKKQSCEVDVLMVTGGIWREAIGWVNGYNQKTLYG